MKVEWFSLLGKQVPFLIYSPNALQMKGGKFCFGSN